MKAMPGLHHHTSLHLSLVHYLCVSADVITLILHLLHLFEGSLIEGFNTCSGLTISGATEIIVKKLPALEEGYVTNSPHQRIFVQH